MLQDFLTAAIEIIAIGFAFVMAIDFVQGLAQRIQQSQQPAAPALQKESSVLPQIAAELMLEDPWLTTLTPSVTQNKIAIAIAPLAPRLLLLPPAIVAFQPRDRHKTEQSKT